MTLICNVGCITMALLCVTCLSLETQYQHRLASEFEAADVPADEVEMLVTAFGVIDKDKTSSIDKDELHALMDSTRVLESMYESRILLQDFDIDNTGILSPAQFANIYTKHFENDIIRKFKRAVNQVPDKGQPHSYLNKETVAFTSWIATQFKDDPDVGKMVQGMTSNDLFSKVGDGLLLCKLINYVHPHTIDERAINKIKLNTYRKQENLNLALNSASSIGCNVVNIGAEDISEGKPQLVLNLVWQIIRVGLFAKMDLTLTPDLASLLMEGEKLADLVIVSPTVLLLRWMNYHLDNSEGYISNGGAKIINFSTAIENSLAYCYLLEQIQPVDVQPPINGNADCAPTKAFDRAEAMLKSADRLGCRVFVTPRDITTGSAKLNMAFVANLFNTHPALKEVDIDEEIIEETREVKTFLNWMNSLGVSPRVNNFRSDLQDCLVFLQLFEKVEEGAVNWDKVNKPPFSTMGRTMEMLQNCNYVVDCGKSMGLNLLGADGSSLREGEEILILAVVWQIMRAYTFKNLEKMKEDGEAITESAILEWTNTKLEESGKESCLTSFRDPSIATSRAVIDLIDAIKPGSIDYDIVTPGNSDKEKMSNAKYAISMARKIGARIYALPEDLMEVNPKMILTVFACLMGRV